MRELHGWWNGAVVCLSLLLFWIKYKPESSISNFISSRLMFSFFFSETKTQNGRNDIRSFVIPWCQNIPMWCQQKVGHVHDKGMYPER